MDIELIVSPVYEDIIIPVTVQTTDFIIDLDTQVIDLNIDVAIGGQNGLPGKDGETLWEEFDSEIINNSIRFGRLYNYYAISNPLFPPIGWRVPTYEDLLELYNFCGYQQAGKLKDTRSDAWSGNRSNDTNSLKLSVLGAGTKSASATLNNGFMQLFTRSYFASTTATGDTFSNLIMMSDDRDLGFIDMNKHDGVSVRLVKINGLNTGDITDLNGNTYNSVTIGNQVWLKQNWACTKYNDGTLIGSDFTNTNGAVAAFNNGETAVFYSEDLIDSTHIKPLNNKRIYATIIDGLPEYTSQIQSDYSQTNINKLDYIKNKPVMPSLTGYATELFVTGITDTKEDKGVAKGLITALGLGTVATHNYTEFALTLTDDENYITDLEKSNLHAPHSDDQDLSGLVVKEGGKSLVLDTEIAKIHLSHSDDQDLSPYQLLSDKGINNGYTPLDSGGKVALQYLPSTLLKYISTWDVNSNIPSLSSPDLTKVSNVYTVIGTGTRFGLSFKPGDWLIYNSNGIPEKSDNSDDVVSVNSQTGIVSITPDNLGLLIGRDVLAYRTFGSASNNNTNDFILNQSVSAQDGSLWINGKGKFDGGVEINNSSSVGSSYTHYLYTGMTEWSAGIDNVDGSYKLSATNGFNNGNIWFTIGHFGAANFVSTLTASNLSNTNTGDETTLSIKTKLGVANTTDSGYVTSIDWNIFNDKVSFPGFGTTHVLSAYGDHLHTGVYQPVGNYLTSFTETDPIFTAWNKSTGITITKSQITDFPTIPSSQVQTDWNATSGIGVLLNKPTQLSQFTNNLGNYGNWITGINSGMVTTALGYIPYNSTNPSGYINSLSGAVLVNQSTPQTIGSSASRLGKLWATDAEFSNTPTIAGVSLDSKYIQNNPATTQSGSIWVDGRIRGNRIDNYDPTLTASDDIAYSIGKQFGSGTSGSLGWKNNSGVPYMYIETYGGVTPISILGSNFNVSASGSATFASTVYANNFIVAASYLNDSKLYLGGIPGVSWGYTIDTLSSGLNFKSANGTSKLIKFDDSGNINTDGTVNATQFNGSALGLLDVYNVPVREIVPSAFVIDLSSGEDFTKTLGTNSAFTISNPIIKKPFRLILTGGTIATVMFTGYTVNWIALDLQTDYIPAQINYLYCEIRSTNQIYVFWGS